MKTEKLIILSVLFVLGCGKGSPTYQTTKYTLQEQERFKPMSFLEVSEFEWWENLIGEAVFEGEIRNSASLATYKDVELEIVFKTKTGTVLDTKRTTIYEFFKPASETHFKFRLPSYPSETQSADLRIVSIKNIEEK